MVTLTDFFFFQLTFFKCWPNPTFSGYTLLAATPCACDGWGFLMGHRALCISVCEDTGVPVMSVLFLVSREFWSQNELGVFPFTILEWFVYN